MLGRLTRLLKIGRKSEGPKNTEARRYVFLPPPAAGPQVTPETAMACPPFASGVFALADALATSSIEILKIEPDGYEAEPNSPVAYALNVAPNPEMVASDFISSMVSQMLLSRQGEAYAEITWSPNGKSLNLWLLAAHRMCRRRDGDGRLYYEYQNPSGGIVRFWPEELLILRQRDVYGDSPVPLIELAKEAISASLAMQEFSGRFFSNGANLGGTLETDKDINPEKRRELEKDFNETWTGLRQAHGVAFLPNGLKFVKISVDPKDAQLVEARKFAVEEIARYLRIPPHILMDLERATFNNIEELGKAFVVQAVMPIAQRFAQEITVKLLRRKDRKARFDLEWIGEGNAKDMAEADVKAINGGGRTIDEVRKRRGLKKLKKGGDKVFIQAGMTTPERIGEDDGSTPAAPRSEGPPPQPPGDRTGTNPQ